MKKEFSSVVETITPEMARQYLAKNSVNRPIDKARVELYAHQMIDGQWKLNGEAISFDKEGNLCNGQHRCKAIVSAGVPVTILVCRNVEEESFKTIDSGKGRRQSDVFAMCDILNYTNITTVVRKHYFLSNTNATIIGRASYSARRLSNQDMLKLYYLHAEEYQEFYNLSQCLKRNYHLYSETEIAAIMCYLHIDRGHEKMKIIRFFQMLFQYNTSDDINVTRLLRERILKAALNKHLINGEYKQKLLAKSWNIYSAGGDVGVLKVVDGETVKFY